MKIAVASDHAGFKAKEEIKKYLVSSGYEVRDFGAFSEDSCDYPDFAYPAAEAVSKKEFDRGIFVCGSGNGMNICANKVKGVRSALVYDKEVAKFAYSDTLCRIICFGARFMKLDFMKECIDIWLEAAEPTPRHQKRISKIEEKEL
ncbi:RpiB/LacA/LacB family sugar-phosphate isomerase [bacterium]|nr:RpiB/LacA/LacB family sugar-phosphate isomerase [bacterium]MBU3955599.1 RpiB/LacA/LacB family sugar-phosphate isomerase [bacterium]MBU4134046.1 RpiB/LacA/LacB family sugar-phosphate isomerase [bacterium]